MNIEKIKKMLIYDEGESLKPYKDVNGHLTIGVGHNLENGISKKVSDFILQGDINNCINDLCLIFIDQGFFAFPDDVQSVLVNMRFQMGYRGFRRFKKMISAIKIYDWDGMIKEMKDSKWYQNFTSRADRLVKMVNSLNIS